MTKGIIQTEVDGTVVRTTKIEESNIVFVIAAKRNKEFFADTDWELQNIAHIDDANRKEVIELLANSVKAILAQLCNEKPGASAGAMQLFLRRFDDLADKYTLEHIYQIMAEREAEHGR